VLYRKYYAATLYLLERKSGNPDLAQDLCQEAFIVLLERLRTRPLDDPEKLAVFLYNIAINLHIADVRKSVRRNTVTDSDLMDTLTDGRQSQYRQLLKERAGRAVRSLIQSMSNSRDRKILYGYFIQEKEKEEICQELELSQRHFDRVLFRAKERFKELITGGKATTQTQPD
jgi:RNA polymerase sigma-70 factor (ECF subfamily)